MSTESIKIAIEGVGCVGGFGCGHTAFVSALQQGYAKAQLEEKVHPDGSAFLPALLADTSRLTDFVARRALRRIDHYARMALLGGYLALEDAGVPSSACEKLGVIVASGYGATTTTINFLDSVIDNGDSYASPTNFSNSVHNVAAAYLSMQLQALGPSLTVSQFELSICAALQSAVCWLEQGRVDKVLIGAVDERNALLNDYCWQRSAASDGANTQIAPFDYRRQSAIAGEGAAFLLLSRRDDNTSCGNTPYGYITGLDSGRCTPAQLAADSTAADVLVLGADGQLATADSYSRLAADLGEVLPLVSCAPCYGSLPTGQAFDLIAAALMLRDQCVYGVAAGSKQLVNSPLRTISALKFAPDGQFGQITLSSQAGVYA
ncbi:MAG: beta-ketoacyl synthase N-terminal-like domain-containing protein [Desulfuromonas sp.]|nr:beta-ketoacyl synthase N-terminal-like domain-containing protein [Desulfuromonas sp.]